MARPAPGTGDAGAQARYALTKMQSSLVEAGSTLADVVRTRMYVTNIHRDAESIGAVHHEFFGEIRPCATMVEVSALAASDALVEIEIDAVIS